VNSLKIERESNSMREWRSDMRSSRLGYGPHSFLNKYISEHKCKKIMEIGVADGGNALRSHVQAGTHSRFSAEA
jgi:hypothetical protein